MEGGAVMAEPQYLSTDPNAGEYLSLNPQAGITEGYWEHPRGERIPQSAVNPAVTQRLTREKGWQWRPPGWAPGLDPTSRRPDTAIMSGLPVVGSLSPEMVVGGVGTVRAVGGAIAEAVGVVPRLLAGVQASVAHIGVPVVKYEVAKHALQYAGVPEPIAGPVAALISGLKRGAKPTTAVEGGGPGEVADSLLAQRAAERGAYEAGQAPTLGPLGRLSSREEYAGRQADVAAQRAAARAAMAPAAPPPTATTTSLAERAAPSASAPAVPAPPAALETPPSAPTPPVRSVSAGWSPQQREAADRLVAQGSDPRAAVQRVAGPPPAAPTSAGAPAASGSATSAAPKLKLTVLEGQQYSRLLKAGKTQAEALQAIVAQRQLIERLGLSSPQEVQQAIAERNATGRWPSPK